MYNNEELVSEAVRLIRNQHKVELGSSNSIVEKQWRSALPVAIKPYLAYTEMKLLPTHNYHSARWRIVSHESNMKGWKGYRDIYASAKAAVDSVFWPAHNKHNKAAIEERIEVLKGRIKYLSKELKENELQYEQKD